MPTGLHRKRRCFAMTAPEPDSSHDADNSDRNVELQQIREALQGLRFGAVNVIVQDGRLWCRLIGSRRGDCGGSIQIDCSASGVVHRSRHQAMRLTASASRSISPWCYRTKATAERLFRRRICAKPVASSDDQRGRRCLPGRAIARFLRFGDWAAQRTKTPTFRGPCDQPQAAMLHSRSVAYCSSSCS